MASNRQSVILQTLKTSVDNLHNYMNNSSTNFEQFEYLFHLDSLVAHPYLAKSTIVSQWLMGNAHCIVAVWTYHVKSSICLLMIV